MRAVYKQLPDSLYNIPAMESWLEDMSRKGWRCAGFWNDGWVKFQKAAPEDCQYRLEPQLENRPEQPDAEMWNVYEGAGWSYVDSTYWKDFCLWRSNRPDPQPLHTDPVAENIAYGWVAKVQRRQLLFYGACNAVVLGLLLLTGFTRGWVLSLVDNGLVLCNLFIVAWCTGQYLMDRRALRRLRQGLAAGVPMDHAAPYGARRRARRVYEAAAVVLLLLIIADLRDTSRRVSPLPPDLPAVTADVLEADIAPADGAATLWTALLADRLSVRQGEEGGSVFCDTQIWDLRPGFLSGPLLRDLANHTVPRDSGGQRPRRLEDARFDGLYYLEYVSARGKGEPTQVLLARRGARVLYLRTNTPEPLAAHLDDFAAALARPLDKEVFS